MLSRKDLCKPIMTAIVELNSKAAYEAIGAKVRPYPRFLPVPDTAVTFGELDIREWYSGLSIFPECTMVIGKDVPRGEYENTADVVLGYSIGVGVCDKSMVNKCKGTPRDIQINKWYEYYIDGTRVQSDKLYTVSELPGIRELQLEIKIDGIGSKVFDYGNILFDADYILKGMTRLIPFKKHDIICMGPADSPLVIPDEYRFSKGDCITVRAKPFEDLIIGINENRK